MIAAEELGAIPLFSELGAAELRFVADAVEDIRLLPGEFATLARDANGYVLTGPQARESGGWRRTG